MKRTTNAAKAIVTAFLSVALLASACTQGGAGTPAPEQQKPADSQPAPAAPPAAEAAKGTIRYFSWPPEQEAATRQSIAEFNKTSPDIKVDYQLAPWEQYWTKLQTEIAGGTAPDVFMNQTFYFLTLQDAKAAEPLTPYIERDQTDMTGHNQKVIDIYTQENVLYAMPQDWDSECIIYNKDLFDRYGVPYPDETLDWNPADGGSFVALAQRMTVDKNGKNVTDPAFDAANISTYGFITNNSNNCFYWNFMDMNGGDINRYDDPKNIETMRWAQELITKYKVSPQVSQVQSMGVDSMFATGSIAMYTMGNWVLKTLDDTCNFQWAAAPLPKGPQGRSTIVNGIGQSIYSGGKNKEAAWQLVKWFGGDASQKIMGETGTVFPSMTKYHQSFIDFWSANGVDINAYQYMLNEANTFIAPLVPHWNEKIASVTKNYDLLFMNKLTSEEAAANIAKDYAQIG